MSENALLITQDSESFSFKYLGCIYIKCDLQQASVMADFPDLNKMHIKVAYLDNPLFNGKLSGFTNSQYIDRTYEEAERIHSYSDLSIVKEYVKKFLDRVYNDMYDIQHLDFRYFLSINNNTEKLEEIWQEANDSIDRYMNMEGALWERKRDFEEEKEKRKERAKKQKNQQSAVYIIENSKNGKKYIGQCYSERTDIRKKDHFSGNGNRLIAEDIKTYGEESFTFNVYSTGITPNEASDLEKQLIVDYNTLHPNGYNLTATG